MQLIDWSKFSLKYDNTIDFAVSQWGNGGGNGWYVLYRLCVVVYFCGFLVWDTIHTYMGPDGLGLLYFVFLTNWTFLCLTITSMLQLYMALHANNMSDKKQGWFKNCAMLQWFFLNLAHSSTIHVCIFYWLFVYPISSSGFNCLHLHVITGVYVSIDLMLQRAPRRLHHFVYPLSFGLGYLLFTWLYFMCGGRGALRDSAAIYSTIDWTKPVDTVFMALLAVVAILVFHSYTCLVVMGRQVLYSLGQRVSTTAVAQEKHVVIT